jgi:hypothetical protein
MRESNKPRVFLYVPDGIGVRNYLYSDLIGHLQGADVGIYHQLPDWVLAELAGRHKQPLELHSLPAFGESKWQILLRDVATFARLRRNSRIKKNPRIWRSLLLLKQRRGLKWWYYLAVQGLSWRVSLRHAAVCKADAMLEHSYLKGRFAAGFEALLTQTRPDVIFCTHRRVPAAGLMAAVARKMGIPMVSAIYSWDNLPKSRIALRADYYMVWSDYMKEEMATYYPEVAAHRVVVTGTPQFECYSASHLVEERTAFLQRYQLPTDRPLVLLSGSDLSSPNDQYYFEDIAATVSKLPDQERPHLILRRAPVDYSNRFDGMLQRYGHLFSVIDPKWRRTYAENSWFDVLPAYEDVKLLSNLCRYCHVVVNIGSTMGLDFAHFDKPAIYLHYQKPYNRSWYDIDFIYGLEHFRTLDGLDAVAWIKSEADIWPVLQAAISSPDKVATDRLKWKYKLTNDLAQPSANIARLLLELAARHRNIVNK